MKNLLNFGTLCCAKIIPCRAKFRHHYSAFSKTRHPEPQICHSELVSESLTDYKETLKLVQGDKRAAFSLVELLMALLVASLLMAALAPVMTKKMTGDKVAFEGQVANPTRKKIVYLTEPGNGEWEVPNGIRNYKVTTVGAGGGGGAGTNYGCVVFTTTATPTGSLLSNDAQYCEHVRTDGAANFTIPDGVDEIYVSLISGAGGGGAGSAEFREQKWDTAGTYTWNVPEVLRGDRILVTMNGGGGGGGGTDQGGGGGGASGGYVSPVNYNVPANKTSIPVVVGAGGKGGYYWTTPGKGGIGYKNGDDGAENHGGGGGGGSSSFDGDTITAFGGGGGGSQPGTNAGWAYNILGEANLWKTVFNYGGSGRNGGTSGPYTLGTTTYGGASGGNGAIGGGKSVGGNGEPGKVGNNGLNFGSNRGGTGGLKGGAGEGKGGYGQDYKTIAGTDYNNANVAGGGAGGGGGGSYFSNGADAPTGCRGPIHTGIQISIAKAGAGAGGAGASCAFNTGGTRTGGDGGDGIVLAKYLAHLYGGSGGQAGRVVPRSRIALTNTMKAGNTLTINLGRGGKGGDRVIAYPNGNNIEIRTMNTSGVINSTTNLDNAKGMYGTPSSITFNGINIATTGAGSCGGGYQNEVKYLVNCPGINCGTRGLSGDCITSTIPGWHGHQSGSTCKGAERYEPYGTSALGGRSTPLQWDGLSASEAICGVLGGTIGIGNEFSKRNGATGSVGVGGGGSYYGGFGGKGGDGYVKIEWGLARNIDRTEAERFSGGGGSAGETITKNIVISPITRKIKYTVGKGGDGATFNSSTLKMQDGADGGSTTFGDGTNYGFTAVTAKGGKGGKSAKITSTYNGHFNVTSITGQQGAAGIICTDETKCALTLNGKPGTSAEGGTGGISSTGNGALGGSGTNINGFDAIDFNGTTGGGSGGGGGISANNKYGKGGKGSNGYIIIEYED